MVYIVFLVFSQYFAGIWWMVSTILFRSSIVGMMMMMLPKRAIFKVWKVCYCAGFDFDNGAADGGETRRGFFLSVKPMGDIYIYTCMVDDILLI
jgi:hypothetical protein